MLRLGFKSFSYLGELKTHIHQFQKECPKCQPGGCFAVRRFPVTASFVLEECLGRDWLARGTIRHRLMMFLLPDTVPNDEKKCSVECDAKFWDL